MLRLILLGFLSIPLVACERENSDITSPQIGRYQIFVAEGPNYALLDTATGEVWIRKIYPSFKGSPSIWTKEDVQDRHGITDDVILSKYEIVGK